MLAATSLQANIPRPSVSRHSWLDAARRSAPPYSRRRTAGPTRGTSRGTTSRSSGTAATARRSWSTRRRSARSFSPYRSRTPARSPKSPTGSTSGRPSENIISMSTVPRPDAAEREEHRAGGRVVGHEELAGERAVRAEVLGEAQHRPRLRPRQPARPQVRFGEPADGRRRDSSLCLRHHAVADRPRRLRRDELRDDRVHRHLEHVAVRHQRTRAERGDHRGQLRHLAFEVPACRRGGRRRSRRASVCPGVRGASFQLARDRRASWKLAPREPRDRGVRAVLINRPIHRRGAGG